MAEPPSESKKSPEEEIQPQNSGPRFSTGLAGADSRARDDLLTSMQRLYQDQMALLSVQSAESSRISGAVWFCVILAVVIVGLLIVVLKHL